MGKGCDSTGKRSHVFDRRSIYHKNIVIKHGRKNILIYVFECESETQAFADEIHQIAQLRKEGYKLCNLTEGGEGASGFKHEVSKETRIKISNANRGRKFSDEHKTKLSNSNYVKKHGISMEIRIKLSIAGKGRVLSEETKKKISETERLTKRNLKLNKELSC